MNLFKVINEVIQKESKPRLAAITCLVLAWAVPAIAQGGLDTGGATFKDFAVADNGASFGRGETAASNGPGARLLGTDNAAGKARVFFESVKVEAAIPMGWRATDDSERGAAFNADQSYRLLVWRVDFAFEGVKDAEQYAATKGGAIEARRPGVRTQARRLADGSFLIAYENVPAGRGDHESRMVFDIITPNPQLASAGVLLTLGVPSSQAERGLKLLALIRKEMRIIW